MENIIKITLPSDTTLPKLKELLGIVEGKMQKLNSIVEQNKEKSLRDLQNLQNLIGPHIKIIIQTRHLICKVGEISIVLIIGNVLLFIAQPEEGSVSIVSLQ